MVQATAFSLFIQGSNKPGTNDIVQWAKEGDAVTQDMTYKEGRLTVEKEGYYYIYSKVIMNAAEECSLSQHKVLKETKAYDKPIELMQSKRYSFFPFFPLSHCYWCAYLCVACL